MINWLRTSVQEGDAERNAVRAASVLVPVTGSDSDESVVRLACELLESGRSLLYILYVIEMPRAAPVDADITSASQQGERVLREMESVAKNYNCTLEAQLVQARKAGAAVVREAVDKGVDAIVMGIFHTEVYGSFSLGEYISYVLRHAPCRVIVSRDSIGNVPGVTGYNRTRTVW